MLHHKPSENPWFFKENGRFLYVTVEDLFKSVQKLAEHPTAHDKYTFHPERGLSERRRCGIINMQTSRLIGGMCIFTGFKQDMLDFMLDIRFHNNKAFMEENREAYISRVRQPYYALIEEMADAMLSIDPRMEVRPAKCLSRIFRDTRFSRDKSPYRDHHWVAFRRAGIPREAAPMYWFEVRVEQVNWGLGYWGENKSAMDIMRRRMLSEPHVFHELSVLLSENDFVLAGDAYQRMKVPDGLDTALASWYKKKELLFVKQNIHPDVIFQKTLPEILTKDYLALAPLYRLMQGCYDLTMAGGKIE